MTMPEPGVLVSPQVDLLERAGRYLAGGGLGLFVLPDEVKARQREQMAPVNVAATYESAPAENTTTTAENTTTHSAATNQESTTNEQPSTPTQTHTTAQNAPAPAPNNRQAAQNEATAATATNTDTSARDREMPSTAANWLTMMLSGGLLSGAGMALRPGRGNKSGDRR